MIIKNIRNNIKDDVLVNVLLQIAVIAHIYIIL